MWELEGMDVTTYSALKHAFDILAAAYRSERASHEAEVLRWSMENQELKVGEANLLEALQAVRDALDAETKAHDLDLKTLETIAKRNMQLEDYLRRIHQTHPPHASAAASSSQPTPAPAAWGPTSTAGAPHPPHHIQGTHFSESSGSLPHTGPGGELHGNFEDRYDYGSRSATWKPQPLPSKDADSSHTHQPLANSLAAFQHPAVVGQQRYCPETDSYRLVTPDAHGPPKEELQLQTESLSKQVRDLRKSFLDLSSENHRLRELVNQESSNPGRGGQRTGGRLHLEVRGGAEEGRGGRDEEIGGGKMARGGRRRSADVERGHE